MSSGFVTPFLSIIANAAARVGGLNAMESGQKISRPYKRLISW
jgi:hypothetical protein